MTSEPQLAVVAEQTGDGPPLVGIVMGSPSDMDTMEAAARELGERATDQLDGLGAHAVQPTDLGFAQFRELLDARVARVCECSPRRFG